MTVPMGTPTTVLISWYDISSISRRISTSRNSKGNASMHACRCRASPARGGKGLRRFGESAGIGHRAAVLRLVEASSTPRRLAGADPVQAGVAHDGDEPGLRRRALHGVEEAKGTQARILDDVLGAAVVAQEPARQVVGGVEVHQHRRLEPVLPRRFTHRGSAWHSSSRRRHAAFVKTGRRRSFIPDLGRTAAE